MTYYPHLWNTFKFIITPDELQSVLSGFHHVAFTHRVSADYVESDRKLYFDAYQTLFERLASGDKLVWKQDWKMIDATTGLTNDLQKCTYGDLFQDKEDGKFYKTSNFSEPCVGMTLFVLYIKEDGKLHTNFSYSQFPEFIVGLEMQYPKNVCYYSKPISDESTQMIPCSEIASFGVYKEITDRVKKFTKNLTFSTNDRAYKTTIKISEAAKDMFFNYYFAQHFHCHK